MVNIEKKRSNNFDLLRLVAALLVIYSHSYALIGLEEHKIWMRSYGNIAVHAFFVISGYLITKSFCQKSSVFSFVFNRVSRIVPGFLVAFVFGNLISNICNRFITNPIPYIINGPVWTLVWEVVCYFFCTNIRFVGLFEPENLCCTFCVLLVILLC